MSKVAIQGNASGTGTLTISAPNTSTDRTLTLPDSTGTMLNDQSDITAQVKTATNASGSAPIYSCRAWVNFNGTGTVAIRASGNVSSITDSGTGQYIVNFTTAMPDTNFTGQVSISGASVTGVAHVVPYLGMAGYNDASGMPNTSSLRVSTHLVTNSGGLSDPAVVCVAIFR